MAKSPISKRLLNLELAKFEYSYVGSHQKDLISKSNFDDQEIGAKYIQSLYFAFEYPLFISKNNNWIISPKIEYTSNSFEFKGGNTCKSSGIRSGVSLTHIFKKNKKASILSSYIWTQNDKDFSRTTFGGYLIYMHTIKSSMRSNIMIGGITNYNGYNWLPAMPLFVYRTYLGKELTFETILPHKLEVRKFFKNSYINIGGAVNGSYKFIEPQDQNFNIPMEYRQTFIKIYTSYHHWINKYIRFNMNLGYTSQFKTYISDKNDSNNQGLFKEKSSAPYINIGFSFSPKLEEIRSPKR